MDLKEAVKDKANYEDIVRYFKAQGDMEPQQLAELAETLDAMSEEIFEHYKALCDILKGQLQRIRRICREEGSRKAFPEESMRSHLAYAIGIACKRGAVLREKYESLAEELKNM